MHDLNHHGRLNPQILLDRPHPLPLHLPNRRLLAHHHRHRPPRDDPQSQQNPLPSPRCRHGRESAHAMGQTRRQEEAARSREDGPRGRGKHAGCPIGPLLQYRPLTATGSRGSRRMERIRRAPGEHRRRRAPQDLDAVCVDERHAVQAPGGADAGSVE